MIHTNRIRSQATPARQRMLDYYDERRIDIIAGIMRGALENGDLELPKPITEYELVFTMMATGLGGYLLQKSDSPVTRQWFEKTNFTHETFGRTVLDGIGWHPVTGEWDYSRTIKRFYKEVFPELASGESSEIKSAV